MHDPMCVCVCVSAHMYLQHTIKQVPLASCKTTPVGQDEQGQALTVKLLNCLSRLVGRVREPHLQATQHSNQSWTQGQVRVEAHSFLSVARE